MRQKHVEYYCLLAIKQLEMLRERIDPDSLEEYIPESKDDFAYEVVRMAYEDDVV